jgi:hypothetical protein
MLLNIFIGLVIIGITVVIQAYGTNFWIKHLISKYYNKQTIAFDKNTVKILIFTAFFLLSLNLLQAIIWAFSYYLLPGITEIQNLEKSIYFSLVTFTTLGYGDITLGSNGRILAGLEAMNGILLLGWTTAMMFSLIQFMVKNIIKEKVLKNK